MLKKFFVLLSAILLMVSLFNHEVSAKSDNAKKSLVALGDSITFGYGLPQEDVGDPSRLSFPYLIGNEADLRVRNLAVSGMKSEELLSAVKTENKYRNAIRKADYLTLYIGGGDLLSVLKDAYIDPSALGELNKVVPSMYSNITKTIGEIRSLNKTAPIVVYNIYNPVPESNGLYPIAHNNLIGINNGLSSIVTAQDFFYGNIKSADAFTTFDDPGYILPGDVHPTVEGQEVLAEIGLEAFGLN
jgi:lysophospholipase L1-like esterase